MKKIILDTNVLIKYPKLLGLNLEDASFIITVDVLSELNERNHKQLGNDRSNLIDQAVLEGNVQIINSSLPKIRVFEEQVSFAGLSATDISLLTTALFYLNQGHEVQISSFDRDIVQACRRFNINLLFDDEIQLLLQLFPKAPKEVNSLASKISNYESKEKRGFIKEILIGLFSALIGFILHRYLQDIYATIHIWGMLGLTLIIGISLFLWREWSRVSYGVFEFAIGFAAIVFVLMPAGFDYKKIVMDPEVDLKILGGLYIMVRGQDNIVKGLAGNKFGLFLKEKFRIGL